MPKNDRIEPIHAPEVTVRRTEDLIQRLNALPDDTMLPAPDGWADLPDEERDMVDGR